MTKIAFLRNGPRIVTGLLVAALLSVGHLEAQVIPAARITDWTPGVKVGVQGGIPTGRTVFTNMTSLDTTGQADIAPALQNAINTCPVNQVVVLPPGTFLLNSTIYLKPDTTLRGAGMNSTILKCYNSGQLRVESDNSYWAIYQGQIISGGLSKGSTVLTLPHTTDIEVGKPCLIGQFSSVSQYDNPVVVGVSGTNAQFGYLFRVVARVTAKTATTISIWPPLQGDMSARHARIKPAFWRKSGIGVEALTINMADSAAQSGIMLTGVQDSWIKDVRVRWARNRSIAVLECVGLEIRDSYLDDLNRGIASNGAGLLMDTISASLIENNLIMNSFPGIEVNAGSCGNVFGYNFLLNTNGAIAIDSNHGPHNTFNLYEGNVANNFLSDAYFGSESDGTVFRNWIHGQVQGQTTIGWAFALKRFTRNYNLVGNILGSPAPFTMAYDGTSFGQPNMGNSMSAGFGPPWADWMKAGTGPGSFQELDTNVVRTLLRKANYNFYNKAIPTAEALGSEMLPDSLYRTSKPAWFGNLAWPPFSPSNPSSLSFTNIPAGHRYMLGMWPGGSSTLPARPSNLRVIAQQ